MCAYPWDTYKEYYITNKGMTVGTQHLCACHLLVNQPLSWLVSLLIVDIHDTYLLYGIRGEEILALLNRVWKIHSSTLHVTVNSIQSLYTNYNMLESYRIDADSYKKGYAMPHYEKNWVNNGCFLKIFNGVLSSMLGLISHLRYTIGEQSRYIALQAYHKNSYRPNVSPSS